MKRNARILAAALAATLFGTSGAAMAAFFTARSSADLPDLVPGDGVCNAGAPYGCTLRAAIQETNALPGLDFVELTSGPYNLTRVGAGEDFADRGDLDIRDHLTLQGYGSAAIDGQFADRVFDIHSFGAVRVVVTLYDMSIHRGYSGPNDGGAIRNAGHLRMDSLIVVDSVSEGAGGGIALVGNAALEIANTRIEDNRAGSRGCVSVLGRGGGGLYVPSSADPNVVLNEVTIRRNESCTIGGGVLAYAAVRLTDAVVADNSASTSFGYGGGVHARSIVLDRVTLENNRSWYGAGLSVTGDARIVNSTISRNTATRGGGISSFGWLDMRHVTMSNNTSRDPTQPSGGLLHYLGERGIRPVIVNSILSDNTLANCRILDVTGVTIPLNDGLNRRNVDTDDSCGFRTLGPEGSIVLMPAGLAPLARTGGYSRTHSLLPESPALDAALGGFLCAPRDQRREFRPRGAACDIGSTEQ